MHEPCRPDVSLVVPVYNVEDYLPACLASICAQSLANIEVLCVDDGSTDGSAGVLEQAAALDGRLRLLRKHNGGLSSARNAGMAAATGRVVMFVDSDDMLEPHACETVTAAFGDHDADIVTFGARLSPPGSGDVWLARALSPRDAVYDGFGLDLLFKERSRPYIWRTALRAAFVARAGLAFDETVPFGEDQVMHFAAYPRAHKTVLLSERLYVYRQGRAGSLMEGRSHDAAAKTNDHITIVAHVLEDWKTLGILGHHAPKMLVWALYFVCHDIMRLGPPEQGRLLRRLKQVLADSFDGVSPLERPETSALTRRLCACVEATPATGPASRLSPLLVYGWYVEQRHMGTAFARMLAAPARLPHALAGVVPPLKARRLRTAARHASAEEATNQEARAALDAAYRKAQAAGALGCVTWEQAQQPEPYPSRS
ncbi:MAG: glycosyltransferase [Coriobacteriales bacterium]|jgi:glycosyltransferase involved in cell wall biosynthesis|nr:glycosyltransferase [Coriobacteriales bacterium]